jgi:hypothetical protein
VSIVLKWLTPFLLWQQQPINGFVYRNVVVPWRNPSLEATLAGVMRQLGRVRESAREA